MATIAGHLNIDALRERYVSSSDARGARHFQTIWLLAQRRAIAKGRADDHVRATLDRADRRALQHRKFGVSGRFATAQRNVADDEVNSWARPKLGDTRVEVASHDGDGVWKAPAPDL